MTRLARLVPAALAVVAWLVSSELVGSHDRRCTYRDYRGREHVQLIDGSKTCPATLEVEG